MAENQGIGKKVYTQTRKFPDYERFGLTSQMQRAVISVSSNIAEGTSRKSGKDQGYFLQVAYSSLMETLSQLILANDFKYIEDNEYQEIRSLIEEISYLLNAYHKSILNPKSSSDQQ